MRVDNVGVKLTFEIPVGSRIVTGLFIRRKQLRKLWLLQEKACQLYSMIMKYFLAG